MSVKIAIHNDWTNLPVALIKVYGIGRWAHINVKLLHLCIDIELFCAVPKVDHEIDMGETVSGPARVGPPLLAVCPSLLATHQIWVDLDLTYTNVTI